MKVVLLAGGFGTRISEESYLKPKPMIEIGERPILWHIMKHYSEYGYHEFIICLGYKQHMIKEFFADYFLHMSDVTFDLLKNEMYTHNNYAEPWKVTLVDTGLHTLTGGRIRRVRDYIGEEPFMLTYGDGVSDIDLNQLLTFHRSGGKIATISTVNIAQRFGVIETDENSCVKSFREKSDSDGSMVNVGFMVLEPAIFHYLEGDQTILEREPLEALVREKQLMAYQHKGFWQCMDTQRDKAKLEELWSSGKAPWKIWKN